MSYDNNIKKKDSIRTIAQKRWRDFSEEVDPSGNLKINNIASTCMSNLDKRSLTVNGGLHAGVREAVTNTIDRKYWQLPDEKRHDDAFNGRWMQEREALITSMFALAQTRDPHVQPEEISLTPLEHYNIKSVGMTASAKKQKTPRDLDHLGGEIDETGQAWIDRVDRSGMVDASSGRHPDRKTVKPSR